MYPTDDDDQPKVQQKAAPAPAAAPKAAPRTIPGGARPAKKAPQEAELNAEVPTAGEGKDDRGKPAQPTQPRLRLFRSIRPVGATEACREYAGGMQEMERDILHPTMPS